MNSLYRLILALFLFPHLALADLEDKFSLAGEYEVIQESSDFYCKEFQKVLVSISENDVEILLASENGIRDKESFKGVNTSYRRKYTSLSAVHVFKNEFQTNGWKRLQVYEQIRPLGLILRPYKVKRTVLKEVDLSGEFVAYNFRARGSTECLLQKLQNKKK